MLSTAPQDPVAGDAMSAREAIKDPFVLEFLDLKDTCSESDLKEARAMTSRLSVVNERDTFGIAGGKLKKIILTILRQISGSS